MDDLVDWADVAAVAEISRSEREDVDTVLCVLDSKYSRWQRGVHAKIACAVRKYYADGLAAGAPKTCETCRMWKRAEYCSLNPEPLRVRTYCDRDYLTRAPGEFCSDHDPRKS